MNELTIRAKLKALDDRMDLSFRMWNHVLELDTVIGLSNDTKQEIKRAIQKDNEQCRIEKNKLLRYVDND